MKIPDKLKIGGHILPISFHDSRQIDNEGEFNRYHRMIRLRKEADIRQDIIDETFLHEIFEAISVVYNLAIEHKSLTVLSEVFFATIRDNDLDFREGKSK